MNWDNVEGNWEEMKGKVREMWGKLTDDDLSVIKGKKEQLTGRLQDRYGYLKERAEAEVDSFLKSFDSKDSKVRSTKGMKEGTESCKTADKDTCCN